MGYSILRFRTSNHDAVKSYSAVQDFLNWGLRLTYRADRPTPGASFRNVVDANKRLGSREQFNLGARHNFKDDFQAFWINGWITPVFYLGSAYATENDSFRGSTSYRIGDTVYLRGSVSRTETDTGGSNWTGYAGVSLTFETGDPYVVKVKKKEGIKKDIQWW